MKIEYQAFDRYWALLLAGNRRAGRIHVFLGNSGRCNKEQRHIASTPACNKERASIERRSVCPQAEEQRPTWLILRFQSYL